MIEKKAEEEEMRCTGDMREVSLYCWGDRNWASCDHGLQVIDWTLYSPQALSRSNLPLCLYYCGPAVLWSPIASVFFSRHVSLDCVELLSVRSVV